MIRKTKTLIVLSSILCFSQFPLPCYSETKAAAAQDDALLIKADLDISAREGLSAEKIKEDIELLKYALSNGYGGKDKLKKELSRAFLELNKTSAGPGNGSSKELCDAITKALFPVPDNHLQAYHLMTKCGTRLLREKKPGVGNNFAKKKGAAWEINMVPVKDKNIPVISLTRMPDRNSPEWKGFIEAVEKEIVDAPGAIIDLRENGGGDNAIGAQLAGVFYGQQFPSANITPVRVETPAGYALRFNEIRSETLLLKLQGEPVPGYLSELQEKKQADYNKSKEGAVEPGKKAPARKKTKLEKEKLYKHPLLILQDGKCASSCESLLEMFEALPGAKTIGEATEGTLHFCPTGALVLPNSGIFVILAPQFNKYDDGRFIEKKGYKPDIPVPAGGDALDAAIKILEKS